MTMLELIILCVIIYCVVTTVFSPWIELTKWCEDGIEKYITPASLYRTYKVNYFGAIMIYILWFIASPISCIISFIAWLCTVGRKDSEE